ncbi:MAG: NADH-quinone oxidoreductase subunit L [Ilumatobacteraceae bacterium]|nr:NADH-quinone oxidoreductase subunit L [Ilumatobacteraceae bacterium]MBP8210285.1 NADH-quinone oxidoreductase subunit L [Ilumatobacteraceae bacterium]
MLAEETEAAVHAAGWFLEHAWLIPLIPAVAFFLIIGFGKRLPRGGSEIGIASMVASLVIAAGTAYQWIDLVGSTEHAEAVSKSWTWFEIGDLEISIGSRIDGLAMMLLFLVAFISTLVQIYSTEYVRGDRRYTHFFASITLFSCGMLTMVLAPNMVQLILGWEIMGLTSFMLIGHWWEEKANSEAALKAFWTVRVGDMGLLVGTAMLLAIFGTLDISEINEQAAEFAGDHKMLMWAAVALFIACIGKSGQFPLHTWLPDAMAGPTPVSSLLHSSTMVVAGVFLVARLYPVFHTGLDINVAGNHFNLIAVIGGITILIAAALAFVQNDIKKVLAYSTVSQLGYMMMGLGVGAWVPAVFHIFTHAFFKCCLFLCAGSVAHTGSHHSFDMKKDMGGLRKKMPITFVTWMISTAALCGVPFFSGFFSKDEIIDSAHGNHYTVFFVIGLIGAFMTTAYMTRATYLTFFGEARGGAAHFVHGHEDHAHEEAHDEGHAEAHVDAHDSHGHAEPVRGKPLGFAPDDSPWQITVPLIILGTLALVSGYLNAAPFHTEYFHEWLHSSIGVEVPEAPVFEWINAVPSIVLVALGFAVSLLLCKAVFGEKKNALQGLTTRNQLLGAGHKFLVNKYYLDALYEKVIVHGIAHPISKAVYWTNQNVLDGIVNAVGKGGRRSGELVYKYIDQGLVDGAVNGSGATARGAGGALQPVQSGKVNLYGALLFGAAAVGALVLVLVNS